MIVCIYGSASDEIDKKYIENGYNLAKTLAKHGHSLVFGAGSKGLMGASARGFKDGGGQIHGVIPKFFEENKYEGIFYDCDELTYTETMAERKKIMEDSCDAFIITPGGIGTFEEFFEALTLKQLSRHQKAIAIFNDNGYYNSIKNLLNTCIEQKFVNKECDKLYKFCDSMEEVIDYIENYVFDGVDAVKLKRG